MRNAKHGYTVHYVAVFGGETGSIGTYPTLALAKAAGVRWVQGHCPGYAGSMAYDKGGRSWYISDLVWVTPLY